MKKLRILSLSDVIVSKVHSAEIRDLYGDVDLVIGCGDLPYYYLEYVVDKLKKPVFFVRGNHASPIEYSHKGNRKFPRGALDLHRHVINHNGLLIAGFEGSIRYSRAKYQYTQGEMWEFVIRLVPILIWNQLRYGRALDILVAHSPLWGFNDRSDPAHRGFRALSWLVRTFKPRYFFHGHIHVSKNDPRTSVYKETYVINSTGAVVTDVELNEKS